MREWDAKVPRPTRRPRRNERIAALPMREITIAFYHKGFKFLLVEKQKVISGVFDKVTIDTLYWMANTGRVENLDYCIATGKEADVYRAKDSTGKYLAVKLYRIEC